MTHLKQQLRQVREWAKSLHTWNSKWNCRTEEMKLSASGFSLAHWTLSPGTWEWATCHSTLDPESPHFLDAQKVKPLLELTNTALVESEFSVAQIFFDWNCPLCRRQVDICLHPAALLWASYRHAKCAYCIETWSDFWGFISDMWKHIFNAYQRLQSAQMKHATPKKSPIDPTGTWKVSYKKISGREPEGLYQEVQQTNKEAATPLRKGKTPL